MVNRHIETFIRVVDAGSFLKAAEQLYISANAVAKQINLLESHLDLTLLHRTAHGVTLTEAGKLIYDEGKKMLRHSSTVLAKARELDKPQKVTIRIGVSQMNTARLLLDRWNKAASAYPHIMPEIVPFEDNEQVFQELLHSMGARIDVIACPYVNDYWTYPEHIRTFHLMDIPVCIACSQGHRLAGKERLTIRDLAGETIIMRNGDEHTKPLYEELKKPDNHIRLIEAPYYDINTFNQIATSNQLLLSAECWASVHPMIVTIPVDWPYTLPYGLIYTTDLSPEVLQFIMAVGKVA